VRDERDRRESQRGREWPAHRERKGPRENK
jgi:hypothetical protein